MQGRQGAEALRHIAGQVDRLIDLLANGSPGGGASSGSGPVAAPDNGATQHFLRLVSTLDPQELHAGIVASALAITGAERGFLTLVEDGHKLRFKSGQQIDQQVLASPGLVAGRNAIKQVLQSGQPVAQQASSPGAAGAYLLCAPLVMGQRLEGALRVAGAVYVDAARPLGDAQLAALQRLAEKASVALENAQIIAKAQRDSQQVLRLKDNITKLYDVGRSISSTLILDDLLHVIVDHVVEVSRAQRGFIMLFEGEAETRRLRFKVGRDARKREIPEAHFRVSTTLAKKAIETKQSQIITEAAEADLTMSMVAMELQSILVTPLMEKGEVLGIVYVDSKQSNKEFDGSDQEIVESLCGQAAVAIINAKLYQDAAERERLTHELHLASKIQSDLLPKTIPPVNGIQLFGLLVPALEVGGDYYDFIPHEGTQDSLTIAIGDVSGKGVGAGLVMAMARSALRSLIQYEKVPSSPLPIMKSLNVQMCRDIPPGMFMTLNLLLWDAESGKLKYAPAGHEHLLIYRARTRTVEKIKAGGVACGVLAQASAMYKEQSLELRSGDHLLLYTDGVTEAMDPDNKQFGLDRTVGIIERLGAKDPQTLCEAIHREIVEFRGPAKPHDDITLVALRVT